MKNNQNNLETALEENQNLKPEIDELIILNELSVAISSTMEV